MARSGVGARGTKVVLRLRGDLGVAYGFKGLEPARQQAAVVVQGPPINLRAERGAIDREK